MHNNQNAIEACNELRRHTEGILAYTQPELAHAAFNSGAKGTLDFLESKPGYILTEKGQSDILMNCAFMLFPMILASNKIGISEEGILKLIDLALVRGMEEDLYIKCREYLLKNIDSEDAFLSMIRRSITAEKPQSDDTWKGKRVILIPTEKQTTSDVENALNAKGDVRGLWSMACQIRFELAGDDAIINMACRSSRFVQSLSPSRITVELVEAYYSERNKNITNAITRVDVNKISRESLELIKKNDPINLFFNNPDFTIFDLDELIGLCKEDPLILFKIFSYADEEIREEIAIKGSVALGMDEPKQAIDILGGDQCSALKGVYSNSVLTEYATHIVKLYGIAECAKHAQSDSSQQALIDIFGGTESMKHLKLSGRNKRHALGSDLSL